MSVLIAIAAVVILYQSQLLWPVACGTSPYVVKEILVAVVGVVLAQTAVAVAAISIIYMAETAPDLM